MQARSFATRSERPYFVSVASQHRPITVGAFLSDSRSANFGTPIPSLPGPGVTSDIGITLKFTLTPGDSASFTGVFVVNPVPEPASMMLATCGFAIVLGASWQRRRSRRRM